MKTENIAPIFKTNLDTKSDKYQQNKKMMLKKLDFLNIYFLLKILLS